MSEFSFGFDFQLYAVQTFSNRNSGADACRTHHLGA